LRTTLYLVAGKLRLPALWHPPKTSGNHFYNESGSKCEPNDYCINPGSNKHLGSEIDLVATYTVNKWWTLQMGYGHFFAGSYIKDSVAAGGGGRKATDADWVYFLSAFSF
jgi:hypothetical protein